MLGKLFQMILNIISRTNTNKPSEQPLESLGPSHDTLDSQRYIKERMEKMHRFEEGVRDKPYKDSLGYWTIGIGHLMDARKGGYLPEYARLELDATGRLSDATIGRLYQDDLEDKKAEFDSTLPWALELDPVRYMCLLDMAFQMGVGGLLTFRNTLSYVQEGNYNQAAINMSKSKWAQQTPNRAKRRISEMATGEPFPYV